MQTKLAKLPSEMKVDELKDLVIKTFNGKGSWKNNEEDATVLAFKVGDLVTFEKKNSYVGRFTVIINGTGMYKGELFVRASLCVTGTYKVQKRYKWVDGHLPVEITEIKLLKTSDEKTHEQEKDGKAFNHLLGMWDEAMSNRKWFDEEYLSGPPREEGDPLSDAELAFSQTVEKNLADINNTIQKFIDEKWVKPGRVLAL